jgi:hypothetical protein
MSLKGLYNRLVKAGLLADQDTITTAEMAVIDGVTKGSVTASKALVVDTNRDLGVAAASAIRNLLVTNLDAGISGTAGTVDIFPGTAAKGKFILSCTDQDGDTAVTLKPAAMGQATVVSIPDPGAATANVLLTDAANDGVVVTATAAELNRNDASANAALMTMGTGADGMDAHGYSVDKVGALFITRIYVDIDGLNSGAAGDIIGEDGGVANCHIGQITAAVNGTIIGGYIECLETPVGGDTDIDLHSATEGTGAEDTAISALTNTELLNSGGVAIANQYYLTAYPAADEYLYLVGATGADATYTAGKLLITLYGV